MRSLLRPGLILTFLLCGATPAGADWPVYAHDNRRSGVTAEPLDLPLRRVWTFESPAPPATAWTGPAKWDAYSGNAGLQSMRNFDPAFFVTAVAGRVYFGSSVDHSAHCLDAATGERLWIFPTGAPVRFPPSVQQDRAWFGSDDGFVYCTGAADGTLVWKLRAAPSARLIPSNGCLISPWPVRTGVLLDRGRALFAASLLPWEPSYLYAVDAATGRIEGNGLFRAELSDATIQGALLASASNLYAPQGRSAPLTYDLQTGVSGGPIPEAGGVFCILTEDDQLVAGPADQKNPEDVVRLSDAKSNQKLVSFSGSNRILVDGSTAWLHRAGNLQAIDRAAIIRLTPERDALSAKKDRRSDENARLAQLEELLRACVLWEEPAPAPFGFILAGGVLIAGLENAVRAVDAASGRTLWEAPVPGRAYGLAAAGGRLFVSTDRGHICCFATP
ncbi:MAG TPA: PQQ-binding-like beta-propeller repeat protein [Verrucomicrobiales bacterium]|nr:PQQ-binding-like beta-propeller repeat protein [Verrucomicrobiales bacterium]